MPPDFSVLPVSESAATRKGRVVLALSEEERSLFFPQGFDSVAFESFYHPPNEPESFEEMLRRIDPEAIVTSWSTPALRLEWLEAPRSLRYVCHTSGSVRNLVPRAFLERGGLVTNWGNLAARTVAEHALLLILASLRRLSEWRGVISGERRWQPSPIVTQTLHGKRVGLHGFGNVAQALVGLLRPFGASISAFSHGVPEELFAVHDVTSVDSLEALFGQSEILVECEALNSFTRGIVTRRLLELLPIGALFINVARGALADEVALGELGRQGRIRLGLDVYSGDPISPDSLLHHVNDAVLSPHIAGPTSDQFPLCGKLVERNLQTFFSGLKPEAIVSLEIYDRAT
ncbi:hydroxyacid dehydrogenase [soil metagenome]